MTLIIIVSLAGLTGPVARDSAVSNTVGEKETVHWSVRRHGSAPEVALQVFIVSHHATSNGRAASSLASLERH